MRVIGWPWSVPHFGWRSDSPVLFTIGFTKKSAQEFFTMLRGGGGRTVIDTRLNNRSQLASCATHRDLEYSLHDIAGINYDHESQESGRSTLSCVTIDGAKGYPAPPPERRTAGFTPHRLNGNVTPKLSARSH